MHMNSTRGYIRSVGGYLPERILTNQELEKMVDTSNEWILQRTGIEGRHIAAETEATSDLATKAAQAAIENANMDVSDIDGIIVATTTPDRIFPSTAVTVQAKLGARAGIQAFDVQAVCSGFIYALTTANGLIATGQGKNILVIGAEKMSEVIDWQDRTTCILFGDGAGAVILSAQDESIENNRGIISSHLHADGYNADILSVEAGVCMPEKYGALQMQGREVFRHAVQRLSEVVDEALNHNQLKAEDIDWLVPHQANQRIIEATAKKLKMSLHNVILTLAKHGNTSAASVPLALYEGYKENNFQTGDLILLEAMGAGLTWGAVLLRW